MLPCRTAGLHTQTALQQLNATQIGSVAYPRRTQSQVRLVEDSASPWVGAWNWVWVSQDTRRNDKSKNEVLWSEEREHLRLWDTASKYLAAKTATLVLQATVMQQDPTAQSLFRLLKKVNAVLPCPQMRYPFLHHDITATIRFHTLLCWGAFDITIAPTNATSRCRKSDNQNGSEWI